MTCCVDRISNCVDNIWSTHHHQQKLKVSNWWRLFVALYFLSLSSIPEATAYDIDGVVRVTFPFTIAVINGKVNSIPASDYTPYLINATDGLAAVSFLNAVGNQNNRMLRAASEVKWRPRFPTAVNPTTIKCPSNKDGVNVENDACISVTATITINLIGDVRLAKRVADSYVTAINQILDSEYDWLGEFLSHENTEILLLSHGRASVASSSTSFTGPIVPVSVIGASEFFVFGLLGVCIAIHRLRG